jgi:hypothetical protein
VSDTTLTKHTGDSDEEILKHTEDVDLKSKETMVFRNNEANILVLCFPDFLLAFQSHFLASFVQH